MTLVIRSGETQTSLIRRTLLEGGEVSVQECLFDMRDEEGNPRAITRLASIIFTLRTKEDMFIIETSKWGQTATYKYIPPAKPEPPRPTTGLPTVDRFMQAVRCPAAGCEELIDTRLYLHDDPVDATRAFVVCSAHGWQAVRVA